MELPVHASQEFLDYTVSGKVKLGKLVCKCMATESKFFNAPPIPLSTLMETTLKLEETDLEMEISGEAATKDRNDVLKLWDAQFRRTAQYVSFTADGNGTMISRTGFKCTSEVRNPGQKIQIIDSFTADVRTEKGTADVSCKKVKEAKGYIMVAADENAIVTKQGDDLLIIVDGTQVRLKISTATTATFANLPSKKTVNISMCAFNSAGTSPLTDTKDITPQ